MRLQGGGKVFFIQFSLKFKVNPVCTSKCELLLTIQKVLLKKKAYVCNVMYAAWCQINTIYSIRIKTYILEESEKLIQIKKFNNYFHFYATEI